MRIAVASTNGENVDLHLGKGKSVYIYDYDGQLSFVEKRDVEESAVRYFGGEFDGDHCRGGGHPVVLLSLRHRVQLILW